MGLHTRVAIDVGMQPMAGDMTLIISVVSPYGVWHVSDRLVTEQVTAREFDAVANKTVLYACIDGIVAIRYTGVAYIKNRYGCVDCRAVDRKPVRYEPRTWDGSRGRAENFTFRDRSAAEDIGRRTSLCRQAAL